MKADRDFYESQSEALAKRAATAESANRESMAWYSECDQRFHRELAIRAAEAGCVLPELEPLSRWLEPAGIARIAHRPVR
ncbi:Uncharacterised protein [Tsukamurella paurometabola]|uniref:Uncharacterized protein n=1 Tax=Tsukamurella paurometabola TaxID=2061 RepID=A0A3P8MEB7_TSUPA|nr:Uncharacterised protein [Tsukamurella paurometabola]